MNVLLNINLPDMDNTICLNMVKMIYFTRYGKSFTNTGKMKLLIVGR